MTPLTPSRPVELDTSLWRYAQTLYRRQGVSSACLELQSRIGLDVCVLIFALYATHGHRALSPEALANADKGLKAWREQVVLPLRQIRQAMKLGVHEVGSELNNWVREQVKITELSAEQVAIAYLDRQIVCLPNANESQDMHLRGFERTLQCVLAHFAQMNGHLLGTLEVPDVRIAAELLVGEAEGLQHAEADEISWDSKD